VSAPPPVLEDGAVIIPARLAALLRAELQRPDRTQPLHPDLRPVAEALGLGSRIHQANRVREAHRDARLAELASIQTRGICGDASDTGLGVLAFAQTAAPLAAEINVSRAKELLGFTSGARVRQLAISRRLVGRKVSGCWYFTREAINAYLEETSRDHNRPGRQAGKRVA
jgi:hypothetical protein